MANWSLPTLTSTYTSFLSELDGRLDDLGVGLDPAVTTVTNPPTNAIRWNSANNRWEKWNGTAWGTLSSLYALTGLSLTGNATISGTLGVTGATTLGAASATTPAAGATGTEVVTAAWVNAKAFAPLASPTFTGTPAAPTAAANTNTTQVATTAYVIGQGASTAPLGVAATATVGTSLRWAREDHRHPQETLPYSLVTDSPYKDGVRVATTAALTATYANGSSGVGATLTNSGTLAALAVDGVTLVANDRVLVKDQATAAQNGIYVVTTVGSASVAWVLTRATDSDTSTEMAGAIVTIDQGTSNAARIFTNDFPRTGTMGTTAVNWAEVPTVNSPALVGTPTAPTAATATNTTQIATTAYVVARIANDAPTKTGTGASGNWPINITGTANTATNLAGGSVNATAGVFSGNVELTGTGYLDLPVGTTAQRPGTPSAGMIRYNSTLGQFEGYTTAWGSIGGGATGGGSDRVFNENDQTVTTSYSITSGRNAVSAGPVTINSGITVTIPSGSNWAIV